MTVRMARSIVFALSMLAFAGCGGGLNVQVNSGSGNTIDVRVSAGAPVAGAMVTVYAVDENGEQYPLAGNRGVLGLGGPTDADGRALVPIALGGFSGPIQVVAGGSALSYVDPTVPPPTDGSAPAVVEIPDTFSLSSFVWQYQTGGTTIVPLTLLTTLADHAALAYARGLDPSHPQTTTLGNALAARDPLFVAHVASSSAWPSTSLRTTVPAALASGPETLVDSAYAALLDVGLNQLARDVAVEAGYGTNAQNAVNAITLVELLMQDVDADAHFDGRAQGGRAIAVTGSPPVAVDSQFFRITVARSLDTWMRNMLVNKSGISTADLTAAGVYLAISTDTSDLFSPGPVQAFDPIDHEPPLISFAGSGMPATLYTNQSSVTLNVNAQDSSGVGAVYAQVDTSTFAGVLQGGTWMIQIPSLPVVGHNPVTVWAVDQAQPTPNSGLGVPGYELTLDILYDAAPPVVSYDDAFASYADERGMSVAADANGRAVVPASYILAHPRAAIPLGGDIYKAATRLSAGTIAASELETTNTSNSPVLRFNVAFNSGTDSPIAQANYTVNVTCPGCPSLPSATGSLLPSPSTASGLLIYDLPLTTDLVPALGSVVGAGSLSVTLDVKDAAGNETVTSPYSFTYHLVGPPLAVTEDTAYPTYGDKWSTYPYLLANETYGQLWNPSTFYGGNVRLVRYIVTNPAPEPVALSVSYQQAANGSWSMVESWPSYTFAEPGGALLNQFNSGTLFTLDGFTYMQFLKWAYPYGTLGAGIRPPQAETSPWPCAATWAQGGVPAHRIGDTANRFVCAPAGVSFVASPTDIQVGTSSTGNVITEVYGQYVPEGGETLTPLLDASGQMAIVPAATAAGPGIVVVYISRSAASSRSIPLLWGSGTGSSRYETWNWEVWEQYFAWSYYGSQYYSFIGYRWGRYLGASGETLSGSVLVATEGLSSTILIGEPAQIFSQIEQVRTVASH